MYLSLLLTSHFSFNFKIQILSSEYHHLVSVLLWKYGDTIYTNSRELSGSPGVSITLVISGH